MSVAVDDNWAVPQDSGGCPATYVDSGAMIIGVSLLIAFLPALFSPV